MRILFGLFFSIFIISCVNDKKNESKSEAWYYDISTEGDSLVYMKNENDKPEGEFRIFKNNGEFATGYFNNGIRDSVFKVFREDKSLKLKTYFIHGKENGFRRLYTNLNNCYLYYFVENDVEKMKYEVYVDSNDSYKLVQVYRLEDNAKVYSGKLLFDNSFNSVIDEIDGKNSTAAIVNGVKSDDILLAFPHKSNNLRIRFYRLCENSKLEIKFGELTNSHEIINVYYQETIDSSGIIRYQVDKSNEKWNFIRALIIEKCDDGQQRFYPLYFNYYLL